MNASELARHLGVSPTVVLEQLTLLGVPQVGRGERYELTPAMVTTLKARIGPSPTTPPMTPEEAFHQLVLSGYKKGDKVGELEIIDGPWHNERMSIVYFDAPDRSRFRMEIKKVSP